MADLVERDKAIEAILDLHTDHRVSWKDAVIDVLETLPSAQPEPSTEIQEILEYLDTTLHPIVSPDNWNVYAELHDMVSKLPSAQPDKDALDDAYAHGYTAAESEFRKRMEKPEPQWIPCSERLPEYGTAVLTCDDYGECIVNHIIDEDDGEWFWNGVVAWMPLPEPWRGEEHEND